jgi:hypothetical protein
MCDSIANGCCGDGGGSVVNISQTIPPLIYISNGNTINTFSSISASNIYADNLTGNILTPVQPYITVLGNLIYLNVLTYANASNFYGTVSTPDQPLITNVGTLANLTVSGTTTSGLFVGDGGGISNIAFANVVGLVSGNVLSNLNASNIAFGILPDTTQATNLTVANTLTTTNIISAGFSSNASNIVFNFDKLTIPYINVTEVLNAFRIIGAGNALSNLNASNLSFGAINSALVQGNTLSNINSANITGFTQVLGNTLSNINASNLVTGVVDATLIQGNTLSNINSANITGFTQVLGNTLSNINASNLVTGVIDSTLIQGNTISNISFSNVVGLVTGNVLSNLNASNLAFGIIDSTLIQGNTISNIAFANVAGLVTGNVLSNLNASNVAFGALAAARLQATQTNITTVGTLTSLAVTNGSQAGWFVGSGNTLSNLNAANVAIGAFSASQLQAAQTNITSVGTLTSLDVTYGVSAASFTGDGSSITNMNATNLTTGIVDSDLIQGNTISNIAFANVVGLVTANLLSNLNASNIALGNLVGTRIFGNTLSNLNASNIALGNLVGTRIFGNTLSNLNASNITLGNLVGTRIFGNTLSNINFANIVGYTEVLGNTLSNINASNLVTGIIDSTLIQGNTISNLSFANVVGIASGNTLSNLNASNLAFGNLLGTWVLGNTLSNINSANIIGYTEVLGNTLSNINASNLVTGIIDSTLIQGNTISNISFANVVGLVTGNVLSNLNASNLAFGNILGTRVFGNTLSNLNASNIALGNLVGTRIFGNTLSNLNASNITLGNIVGTRIFGNTLSNINAANIIGYTEVSGNTLSNINASNIAFGAIDTTYIQTNQTNITSVGVLTDLTVATKVTADWFIGDGNTLSNINASNIAFGDLLGSWIDANTLSNLNASNIAFGNLAGTRVFANTLSNINASNIVLGNLVGTRIFGNTLSNINASNIVLGNLVGTRIFGNTLSNLDASNIAIGALAATYLQTNQSNITAVGILNDLTVATSVSADNFIGDGNTLSNINASNILFGDLIGSWIDGNTLSNLNASNIAFGNAAALSVTGNVNARCFIGGGNTLSNINASNIALGNLVGTRIFGNTLSNLNASNIVNFTANLFSNLNASNIAIGALAATYLQTNQSNITSVGTLNDLTVATSVTADNFIGDGNTLSNLNASNIAFGNAAALSVTGNVNARWFVGSGNTLSNLNAANVTIGALSALQLQAAQTNITTVGTLTSLAVTNATTSGWFIGGGNTLSNIQGANVIGAIYVTQVVGGGNAISNLNASNVAIGALSATYLQNNQTNITSVGTLTSLDVTGATSSGWFIGSGNTLSNLNAANVTIGALSASQLQAVQTNITSVGTLSTLTVADGVTASQFIGSGNTLSNLIASNISGNLSVSNLTVTSNILAPPSGNTYVTGNLVISGNVFSSLGSPLGAGGGYYLSLPSLYAIPVPYTGGVYGTTYPFTVGLSNGFSITGTSTVITVTPNGNFKFSQQGVYKLTAVLNGTDNITGLALGSNVADVHGQDQNYLYRHVPFITQNPTELIEIPFNVTDETKYYYLDLFMVPGSTPQLYPSSNTVGGTYLTITPLQGGGLASGGPGGTPGTQWVSSGSNIYYSNSVGIGAINPGYNLDISGNAYAYSFISNVITGRTTSFTASVANHYIGLTNGRSVTLPAGSTCPVGKTLIIKDEASNASANNITLTTSGGDLIDGNSTVTLALDNISVTTLWTGTRWSLI